MGSNPLFYEGSKIFEGPEINEYSADVTVVNTDGSQTTLFWKFGVLSPHQRHPEDNPYS